MIDERKTKKQLISELEELRQRIAGWEGADPERILMEKVMQSEARLAEAQRMAHLGSYEFDVPDGEVIWSQETFRLLDRDPSLGEPSINEYLQIVHPEDRSLVEKIVARAVSEKQPFDFEYRVIVGNGMLKHIQSVGEPVLDENGTVVRIVGTIMDITDRIETAAALRESERRFWTLVELAPIGIYETDAQGKCLYVNEKWQELAGLTLQDALGDGWQEGLHKEDRSRIFKMWDEHARSQEPWDMDYRFCTPDGNVSWVMGKATAIRAADGRLTGHLGVNVDITERKLIEDSLREYTERLLRAQHVAKMGFLDWNLKTDEMIWSDHVYELYGIDKQTRKADIDLTMQLVHPDDAEFVNRNLEMAIKGEKDYDIDHRKLRPDGKVIWVHAQAELFRDANGNPESLLGSVVDITERKRVEEALRESEERYRKISALSSDFAASYWIEPDGTQRVEWATEAFLRITGYSPEEIAAGGGNVSIAHPQDKEILERRQKDLLTGKPVTSEYRILTKSGKVVWLRDYAMSDWGVPEGRVVRIYGAAQDITERKKAEEELEDIFNLSPNMVGVFTTDGKLLKVNPAWETVLGYSQKELLDLGWAALVHPDDVEITNKEVEKQLKGSTVANFINRYKCKDGSYKSLEWQASFAKEGIVHATARDITERMASERALEQSEIRYRTLFENMLTGFVYCKLILDDGGGIADVEFLEVNKVFEAHTGISREDIKGMRLSEVVPDLNEANPELFENYAKAVLAGESVELEEYISPLDQWVHVMVFSPKEGYAVVIFKDITQRKQAEMEVKQNAERLATLREIDRAILAAQSTNEIAQSAIVQLKDLINAYRISIALFEPDDMVNVLSVAPVDEETKVLSGTRLTSDQVAIRDPLWQGEVYSVDDIETLSDPSPVDLQILKEGVKSYVNIPLMVQEELIGTINIGADRTGAFHSDQIEIACEVADSLAIALQQARLFEQVKLGRDRLQLLSRRLVEGQETERRYIAQELHDEVGQVLTSLKLSLKMNKDRLPDEDQIEFKETEDLIDVLLKQVRDLSLDLRPAMLDDLGLLPAILWQVERFEIQTGIVVMFEHSGLADRHFLPEIETAAYRIVQEALTNVARHAQVGTVEVQAHYEKDLLTIEIEDEGVGFDVAKSKDAAISLGLVGMEERATMLGGSIKIESVTGKGTKVRAEIPLGGTLERRRAERGQ